jgi:hypothetical protein
VKPHEKTPQRLTIDVNIARDHHDTARPGHGEALELFRLARTGLVELATAPQGYRIDVRGALGEQLNAMLTRENVPQAPQLAYPSEVTYPSESLLPGAYVEGLAEAWDKVVATWRSHEGKAPQTQDRWHVETHLNARRDVFLTNDRPLVTMCHRLQVEHGVPITAMSLAHYLQQRAAEALPSAEVV